jgi:hypothetical protein
MTRSRVSSDRLPDLLMHRDTEAVDTPATRATSRIEIDVGRLDRGRFAALRLGVVMAATLPRDGAA